MPEPLPDPNQDPEGYVAAVVRERQLSPEEGAKAFGTYPGKIRRILRERGRAMGTGGFRLIIEAGEFNRYYTCVIAWDTGQYTRIDETFLNRSAARKGGLERAARELVGTK